MALLVSRPNIAGAGSSTITITQTSHGFVVGDIVRFNGTDYVLAQADGASNADVAGIISEVVSANSFKMLFVGQVVGLVGLTPGDVYFLSESVAGALTATEPTGLLQVSKPLLIATSATEGFFYNWRGIVIDNGTAIGDSGFSGYSGYSGSAGSAGSAGSSGYSGYSGAGTSGYSGYSGAGTSGYSGYSGPSGTSGYSGYSGSKINWRGAVNTSLDYQVNDAVYNTVGSNTSSYICKLYVDLGTTPAGIPGSGASWQTYWDYLAVGQSGYSGYSGAGTSGYSGYSGAGGSGYSGYSGVGTSGYSGYSGAGTSGYSGYSGAGTSGYSGYSGAGLSGYSGYSGIKINWRGQNNTGLDYNVNDAVYNTVGSNTSSYICKAYIDEGTTPAGIPGVGASWTTYWDYLAVGQSGYSGYSGSVGTSGYSGYSGIGTSGYSGYSGVGTSGYSGYSGAGTSGYSGYSGAGTSGYSGYSGAGLSGYSGYSGPSGYSGYSGLSGYSGYSGRSGYSGYSGSGISGYSGYSGAGASGYSGYSGKSGYSGYSGPSGYSGYSGRSGYSGYSGSGVSGYSGYSGAGLSGYSGYSGAASTSGYSGYSGRSGYSGYSGSGVSGYSGYSGGGISGYSGYSGAGTAATEVTPSQITANQNDYNTQSAYLLRISSDAAGRKITGLSQGGGTPGTQVAAQILYVRNVGDYPIIFQAENTSSTAANRIALPEGLPWIVIRPTDTFEFVYDGTLDRWKLIGGYWDVIQDPNYCIFLKDDFIGGVTSSGNSGELGWSLAGTGSTLMTTSIQGRWGVRNLQVSTDQQDRGANFHSTSASYTYIPSTDFFLEVEFEFCIPTLATVGEDFYVLLGATDHQGTFASTFTSWGVGTGIFFEYDRSVSTDWRVGAGKASGPSRTIQATSPAKAVDTNWHNIRIRFDTIAANATYYYDGVLVGTITTNIPTTSASDLWSFGTQYIYKTAGNGAVKCYVDHYKCLCIRDRAKTTGGMIVGGGE